MKIVFVEPKPPAPHVYSKVKLPRLGALILGTILKEQGHQVRVYVEEVSGMDLNDALSADLVCLSSITSTAPRAYWIADQVRKAGIPVIMGGPHVSFLPEEALRHADYVVRGEGELVLPQLVERIQTGEKPYQIPGVSFLEDDRVVNNPRGPFIQELDSIPAPEYTLIPNWERVKKCVSIETSRGCPYDCSFCAVVKMFGRKYRFNSLEAVMEKLRPHVGQVPHIFFSDDNFTAHPERAKELLRCVLREGLKFDWSAQVRVEAARDLELLELMKRTRCFVVYVGLESVNPRTLELYRKRQTVEDIKKCIRNFHRFGIHVHGMFVLGSDEDEPETIRDTMRVCQELKIDSVQYLMLTPIPGTETFEQLKSEKRIFNFDWSYYDGHNAVFEPKKMSAYELQVETLKALNQFYTYRSALRYALKLDYYYTIIRLYGIQMVNRGKQLKGKYENYLREKIISKLSPQGLFSKRTARIRKIIIPSGLLQGNEQKFLSQFLKKLHVEVLSLEHPLSSEISSMVGQLTQQLQTLSQQADLVLVPKLRSLPGSVKTEISRVLDELRLKYISVEITPETLYKSCTELGLALDKKLSSIRRAYFKTLKQVPLA